METLEDCGNRVRRSGRARAQESADGTGREKAVVERRREDKSALGFGSEERRGWRGWW